MIGIIALVALLLTVAFTVWYIFGRTSGLKKKWDAGVISRAEELGAVAVKKSGTFSFSALRFDDVGPTPVTVMVFNGVPLEQHIARSYSYLNTNDWMTLIEAPFPDASGVQFSCAKGETSSPLGSAVPTGDEAFDQAFPVCAEESTEALAAWSPRARELMTKAGAPFMVISGGAKVTVVARGVIADAEAIRAMATLAGELARGGAKG